MAKHSHTHDEDCESYQFSSDIMIDKSRSKSEIRGFNISEREIKEQAVKLSIQRGQTLID